MTTHAGRLFAPEWDPDERDTYLTPPYIIEALSLDFDLDPATVPGGVPWINAAHVYDEADDGLTQPWSGTVWLNPPYSDPRPWLDRLATHGDGVALMPVDTATRWWTESALRADTICFLRERVVFRRPHLKAPGNRPSRIPSALIAYGTNAAVATARCGLGWIVDLQRLQSNTR